MFLVTSEHLEGTTQPWVIVTLHKSRCTAHLVVITLGKFTASECEISTTRGAAHAGTTTIIQAKVVETREWVGGETGTPREKEARSPSQITGAHTTNTGGVCSAKHAKF